MYRQISINIRNLGPIKTETTIHLGQFMIFSGNSGLGKSYLAMLVHFVYRVLCGNEIDQFFHNKNLALNLKNDVPENGIVFQLKREDFLSWVNKAAITYMSDLLQNPAFSADFSIDFPEFPESLDFRYEKVVAEMEGEKTDSLVMEFLCLDEHRIQLPPNMNESSGSYVLFLLLKSFLLQKYNLRNRFTFFMPPSRGSLIAVPEELIFRLRGTMGMYRVFLEDLAVLKSLSSLDILDGTASKAHNILKADILHGNIHLKDNDLVYHVYDNDIPITAAASSIKELTPFALMIEKKLLGMYAVLFEEPESHLHPELQVKVADLLGYSLLEGAHLQITTHSDFILRRLNDLIRLYSLKSAWDDDTKFAHFCEENGYDEHLCIDPSCVKAYFLKMDEHDNVVVQEQDVVNGIPFDSFEKVVSEQLNASSVLYDEIEKL